MGWQKQKSYPSGRMGRIKAGLTLFSGPEYLVVFMPTVQWLDPLYFVYSPFGPEILL